MAKKLKLFKGFDECCAIVETFLEDLTVPNRRIVKRAILRAKSMEEKEGTYHVFQIFRSCLWDIPEAVSLGFSFWLQTEVPERRRAMEYHGMI